MEYELKAIVLDIDGTITDETRRVCVNAVNTIYRAENKIVPIIFVTGNVRCKNYSHIIGYYRWFGG